ncbi:MAG: STAS domain-containing protein [Leptospiraceae bacterium]|nr:STAS domain-containing protein [Leptospiraceae bacterium]
MQSELASQEGFPLLLLSGKLDLEAHRSLSDALTEAWNTQSPAVMLDLADVDVLSSSGAGAILAFHNRMHKSGRKLVLVALSEVCERVLALLQLEGTFETYTNRDRACQALQSVFEYQLVVEPEFTELQLKGRLDLDSHKDLTGALSQMLSSAGRLLLLNLHAVTILGSSAAGALIAFQNQASAQNRQCALIAVPPKCLEVITLLELDGLFQIFTSRAQALEQLPK